MCVKILMLNNIHKTYSTDLLEAERSQGLSQKPSNCGPAPLADKWASPSGGASAS